MLLIMTCYSLIFGKGMLELVILSYTYIGRHIIQTSKYELTGFHCVKRA